MPEKHLPDGRTIQIQPLTFNRARLSIGITGSMIYDDQW